MKILFWLYKSRTNKAGLAPIMMRITINGQRVAFSTNIYVACLSWDPNKQRIKGNSPLVCEHNNTLIGYKGRAWHEYNENLRTGVHPTAVAIKDLITGKAKPAVSLLDAVHYHIKYLESRVGIDIASNTLKKYQTLLKKLEAFLKHLSLLDINLGSLKNQFILDFDTYMRKMNGLSNNGVVKNMQQFKRIIRISIQNGWLDKDPFIHYQCKSIEIERGYLNAMELDQLTLYLFSTPKLERVRDLFVFCCYTGLSYADLLKLSSSHVETDHHGISWIKINRTKTGNNSVIPLLPIAKDILNKYANLNDKSHTIFPVISNQNLNKYLKEIASVVGISKRISMHLARHTFATTVTLEKGIDITTVSKMLGHKTVRTTQIYSKVTQIKIAADMQKLL